MTSAARATRKLFFCASIFGSSARAPSGLVRSCSISSSFASKERAAMSGLDSPPIEAIEVGVEAVGRSDQIIDAVAVDVTDRDERRPHERLADRPRDPGSAAGD